MVKETFPPKRELTQQELERSMTISLESKTSLADLLKYIFDNKTVSYAINKKNLKIFLSIHPHATLLRSVGMRDSDNLVEYSHFGVDTKAGTVKFDYILNQHLTGRRNIERAIKICDAAQEKIKIFLRENGIEVR